MKRQPLVGLLLLSIAMLILNGCSTGPSEAERQALGDVGLVMPYFPMSASGTVSFDFGPHQEGTAIIGPEDIAFWVKDGRAYTVNQAARDAAPELDQAPDTVQYDLMFEAAVRGGFDE